MKCYRSLTVVAAVGALCGAAFLPASGAPVPGANPSSSSSASSTAQPPAPKPAPVAGKYALTAKAYYANTYLGDQIKGQITGKNLDEDFAKHLKFNLYTQDVLGEFSDEVKGITASVKTVATSLTRKTYRLDYTVSHVALKDKLEYRLVVSYKDPAGDKVLAHRDFTGDRNGTNTEKEERKVSRVAGFNRINTSIQAWKSLDTKTAIIAGVDGEIDMVTAAPLAKIQKTGFIYTQPNNFSFAALTALKDRGVKYVTIIGGENVVGPQVANTLKENGISVERIAGETRYDTAVKIAKECIEQYVFDGHVGLPVYLATGSNYVDALTAGPVAAARNGVVLLTSPAGLTKSTKDLLSGRAASITAIGGLAAREVRAEGLEVEAIVGVDRYETAAKVFNKYFSGLKTAYVTTGEIGTDAVVAGPLAAEIRTGVLLTRSRTLPLATRSALSKVETVIVIGGSNQVSDRVLIAISSK